MYECPLLAKHAINVAIAGKADMGAGAPQMSAFDPKRALPQYFRRPTPSFAAAGSDAGAPFTGSRASPADD